jgi:subtilisin family serine protease
MAEYIVLRDLSAPKRARAGAKDLDWSAGPFESVAKSIREAEHLESRGTPPQPEIQVHNLDPQELAEVAAEPDVVGLTPPMPIRLIAPLAVRKASQAGDAWGVAAVGADATKWTGEGVTVAVLDTGIDSDHPAFAGVKIVEEDFSGSGLGDKQGHGTHCAGTIFGRDVDGRRIGIARGVERVLIGKVLDNRGGGTSRSIFEGIQWALGEGAQVVSMSLGFDFPGAVDEMTNDGWPVPLATSNVLEAYRANLRMFDALMIMARAQEQFDGGAVVVAAAGNESRVDEDPRFKIAASLPAAAEGVISVAALGQDGERLSVAPFSNRFPQVSAPGVDIVSAKTRGGLQTMSGTSMACPHVAGVAALWWQALRKEKKVAANATAVIARLRASARADVFGRGAGTSDRGDGIVSAPA